MMKQCALGWIFHVTDHGRMQPRFNRTGLMTDVKGTGKGARDAIHFMYHNDNGQGYIRMAEGTTPPRHYQVSSVLLCVGSKVH